MATISTPISASLFATALKDLPLDTLYAKALELQNSTTRLLASNTELQTYADAGDEDCREAIIENEEVIKRNTERIALCKAEAEGRGLPWAGEHVGLKEAEAEEKVVVNGGSGSLSDEELQRRLAEQLGNDDEDDGVHL